MSGFGNISPFGETKNGTIVPDMDFDTTNPADVTGLVGDMSRGDVVFIRIGLFQHARDIELMIKRSFPHTLFSVTVRIQSSMLMLARVEVLLQYKQNKRRIYDTRIRKYT